MITEEQHPNYAQPGQGAESGEFYVPPTTHFIATVEDLTVCSITAPETSILWTTMPERSNRKPAIYRTLDDHLFV